MRLLVCAVLFVACAAPSSASVTIAPTAPASATPASSCPAELSRAMGASCALGAKCTYPDVVCVCESVPYCPGGVVRLGPPPPDETVQFECMQPDCVGASEGGPCAHAGVECRGPRCYSHYACTAGRWSVVQLGPPP